MCLLSLLQEPPGTEPSQAPHYNPEGCTLRTPHCHPGVHVHWRGQHRPGPDVQLHQDGHEAQSKGTVGD